MLLAAAVVEEIFQALPLVLPLRVVEQTEQPPELYLPMQQQTRVVVVVEVDMAHQAQVLLEAQAALA